MATKPLGYLVMWHDENGGDTRWPYGADPDCEGAIQLYTGRPLLFSSRKAARRAINISTKLNRLRQAQGKPVNADFLDDAGNLRVVPVYGA